MYISMQKQTPIKQRKRPTTPESYSKPTDLLWYNDVHQVIICSSCEYAIQPSAVARHLKEVHRIRRNHRRPYAAHVAGLQLSGPEQVLGTTVREDQFPVPGLPLLDGLQCLRPGCGHLCVTKKRMQQHWLAVHERSGCVSLDWQSVPLQTFFRGNLLKYFTHPSLSATTQPYKSKDDLRSIQKTWDAHYELCESDQCLLTNYLYSTHASLANRHGNEYLWQVSIPRMAATLPFLRHGILALSALHIACEQDPPGASRERLFQTAFHHQSKAMALFQEAIVAASAMSTQCHAIIAFIHVQSLFTLALFPRTDLGEAGELLLASPYRADLGYISPWLYYIRQGCHIVCGFWDTVSNGPLGTLSNSWEIPTTAEDKCSSQIAEIFKAVMMPNGPAYSWSDEEKDYYLHAASDLAIALSEVHKLGETVTIWDVVRLWPLIVSEEFILQLKDLRPGPLLLVACYSVALESVNACWYAKGVHSTLRSNIFHHLNDSLVIYCEDMIVKIEHTFGERTT